MLRSHQKKFALIQKITDLLVITASWIIAYYIRFPVYNEEHFWYFRFFIILIFLQYYFFRKAGIYSSQRLKSIGAELFSIFRVNITVTIAFVICVYFFSPDKISRAVLINYTVLSTLLLLSLKLVIRVLLRKQRSKGINLRYVLLVGNSRQLEDYVKVLKNNPELGLRIKGWVDSQGINEKYQIKELSEFSLQNVKELGVDQIVLGYFFKEFSKVDEVLKVISNDLLDITILPDLSYALIGHEMGDFAGLPVININQPKFSSRSIILKRIFDLFVSGIALLIISPFLGLLALGVKLSSPGPVLFGQKRVGLDGVEFCMWKFRSMRVDSEANGSGWTTENDPRRTRFGTFLRKTSFDELPQLWNVFIGEMSLVGPRPEQPFFVNKFKAEIPAYMLRHKMKAGITGWAQVNGWRGDTSISARIECDIWYIKNWSVWLDVSILFMTFWKGFVNKNAY